MSDHVQLSGPGKIVTLTRGIVWVFFGGALLASLGTVVWRTIGIVGELSSGRIGMSLVVRSPLPPEADAGSASISAGEYDSAWVVLEDLAPVTVAFETASEVASALTSAALGITVAIVAWRVLHRKTFKRSLSMTVSVAGAVILIGTILAIGAGVAASFMAASELNAPADGLDGFWPVVADADLGPLGVGVALMVVGLAFEYGERLQRDSEGLV